jgi:hypothetical protein
MKSRVSVVKEAPAPKAPQSRQKSEYFSPEKTTERGPQGFGFSLAGVYLFASGEDGDETQAKRAATDPQASSASRAAPPIVHEVLRSSGGRLAPATRNKFESMFGQSFRDVRIHTGAQAAASAKAVDARAYTVGRQIAFGAGEFSPETPAGRGLLGHELTHVAQQSSARPAGEIISIGNPSNAFEREAETGGWVSGQTSPLAMQQVQRVSIWQKIIRFFGAEGTFEDDELQKYLKLLDEKKKIEDNYDSDNKAREIVRRWHAGKKGYALNVPRKVLLLKEMISGPTLDDDEKGMLTILEDSTDADLTDIFKQVTPKEMRGEIDGDNRVKFDYLMMQYNRRNSDRFAETKAVSPTQHLVTEAALNPGATLEDEPKKEEPKKEEGKKDQVKKEEPPKDVPPPKLKEAPPMAGISPDPAKNVPGDFEKEMSAVMKKYLSGRAKIFQAAKKSGNIFPSEKARDLGAVAQKSTEEYFGPYIQVASRAPADSYHPGSFNVKAEIHSQAEVPITLAGTPGHPGRLGWMQYWMAQEKGKPILDKFHCVTTRDPDKGEFTRVRDVLGSDATLQSDIDDTIHGWPAEASGGINLDLMRDTSTQDKARKVRWDIYTTLLHEMMHILQHPNYRRAYELFTGSAQEILKEGMADVMRRDLWFGEGNLKKRLSTSAYDATRAQIEGGEFDYKEDVVNYHRDYPNEVDARKIVNGDGKRPGVGMPNARAAFFMGHTDLLGIGEGTRGALAPLDKVANYHANDEKDADIVVAQAGDTLDTIRQRTGATLAGILNESTGKAVNAAAPLAAGTRLKIPGIRYVYTIEADTLGSVASQNHADPQAIAVANGLPAATLPEHKFPAGTKLLIPIHKAGP